MDSSVFNPFGYSRGLCFQSFWVFERSLFSSILNETFCIVIVFCFKLFCLQDGHKKSINTKANDCVYRQQSVFIQACQWTCVSGESSFFRITCKTVSLFALYLVKTQFSQSAFNYCNKSHFSPFSLIFLIFIFRCFDFLVLDYISLNHPSQCTRRRFNVEPTSS